MQDMPTKWKVAAGSATAVALVGLGALSAGGPSDAEIVENVRKPITTTSTTLSETAMDELSCHASVRDQLRDPSSAEFGTFKYFDPSQLFINVFEDVTSDTLAESYAFEVGATNGFGGRNREVWVCMVGTQGSVQTLSLDS